MDSWRLDRCLALPQGLLRYGAHRSLCLVSLFGSTAAICSQSRMADLLAIASDSDADHVVPPPHDAPHGDAADLLAVFSDDESELEGELTPVSVGPQAELNRQALVVAVQGMAAGRCGRGSRGGLHERRLLSTLMHQGRQRKRRLQESRELTTALANSFNACRLREGARRKFAKLMPTREGRSLLAQTLESRRHRRWLSADDMLDLTFGRDSCFRSHVSGVVHGIHPSHARRVKIYVADCLLQAQLHCLGWLCKLCIESPPDIVLSRLAWDETDEVLTMCLPTSRRSAEQQRSTWHIMVPRVRLIVGWLPEGKPPAVIDWTLIVPPVAVRTPSAAELYYSLFHGRMTHPIMMARQLLLRRAKFAMDLSETDDAAANTRFEMHLLHKATAQQGPADQGTFKAHMVCRLHQQQLIEVLLIAVASAWLLSRLYSFTILMRGSGIFLRIVKGVRDIVQDAVVSPQPQPRGAAAFLKEFKGYIADNWRRFQQSFERTQAWPGGFQD